VKRRLITAGSSMQSAADSVTAWALPWVRESPV
jgi:hypothetical protein